MRRKDLRKLVYFVILIYAIAIIFGTYVTLKYTNEDLVFRLFFSLIPFILAIPLRIYPGAFRGG
ncbi:MAG: hypothetical protein EU535_05925 [Promethearchaeota archaeon]|nr:MAG: hypothetical protein EU535_05925 [Candidatus Lokiarchaeota archaeon]